SISSPDDASTIASRSRFALCGPPAARAAARGVARPEDVASDRLTPSPWPPSFSACLPTAVANALADGAHDPDSATACSSLACGWGRSTFMGHAAAWNDARCGLYLH